MAQLLDNKPLTFVSFPIVKVDKTDDGDLLVWGKATDGSVDSDQQIVDPDWSGKALEKWLSTGGNVRVMHSAQHLPAGKGMELDKGDDGHWVRSLVVEPTAKRLVEKGVLQAYSVGISNPRIVRDATAKGGRIVDGEIHELSLVDRPANKNCGITLVKRAADGGAEAVEELFGELGDVPAGEVAKAKKPAPLEPVDDDADEGDEDDLDDDDTEDPEDDEQDLGKSYDVARQAWLAREPHLDGAATTGTAFLAKRAEWQRWHAEGDADGLDGTVDGRARWVAKRQMDPHVGGGVDRDKIPDSDFVDPDQRRFPIVTPKDVHDAPLSYGRADPLVPMDQFRERLTAIAHRKGPAFVAQLPDSWGDGHATKGAKTCPSCGAGHDADSKMRRCEKCGKKLPKATMKAEDAVDSVDKGERMVPPDVKPAGQHREPDGTTTVEELEHDAGMPTDPDKVPDKVPASVDVKAKKPKKGGKKPFPGAAEPFGANTDEGDDKCGKSATPYSLKRMHDAVCAAYGWDTVAAEYPALKSVADAVVPAWFVQQVQATAAKGDLARVAELATVAQDAGVLAKGQVDPAALADGRAWLHKAFTDMYPDTHPTPAAVTPGQFQRPYLRAGHSPLNASGASGAANIPPASHVPDPDDFNRGLITAGHQAESPADKANNLDTGGTISSGAARTYYTNASKESARGAMQAMHDHIAATFPDMCPMATSKSVMPPDMGDTNRPTPVKPMDTAKAPGEKTTEPTLLKAAAGLSKKDLRRIIKSALAQQAQVYKAQADTYQTQIAALKAEIDALGAQPDPAQAPLRGAVVRKATTTDTGPVVAPKRSLVEEAQAQAAADKAMQVAYLQKMADPANPNPATREQAEAALQRLLTT